MKTDKIIKNLLQEGSGEEYFFKNFSTKFTIILEIIFKDFMAKYQGLPNC